MSAAWLWLTIGVFSTDDDVEEKRHGQKPGDLPHLVERLRRFEENDICTRLDVAPGTISRGCAGGSCDSSPHVPLSSAPSQARDGEEAR